MARVTAMHWKMRFRLCGACAPASGEDRNAHFQFHYFSFFFTVKFSDCKQHDAALHLLLVYDSVVVLALFGNELV